MPSPVSVFCRPLGRMTAGRCPGAAALIVGVGGRKTGAEQKIAEWVSVVGRVDVGQKLDGGWTKVEPNPPQNEDIGESPSSGDGRRLRGCVANANDARTRRFAQKRRTGRVD